MDNAFDLQRNQFDFSEEMQENFFRFQEGMQSNMFNNNLDMQAGFFGQQNFMQGNFFNQQNSMQSNLFAQQRELQANSLANFSSNMTKQLFGNLAGGVLGGITSGIVGTLGKSLLMSQQENYTKENMNLSQQLQEKTFTDEHQEASNAFEQGGLPGWLAYGGSNMMSSMPRTTTSLSGQNSFTQALPGNVPNNPLGGFVASGNPLLPQGN